MQPCPTALAACRTEARSRWRRLVAGLALLAASACASIDSTPDAPLVQDQDRARAAQQHPAILAEFGGAYEGGVEAYVDSIGQKVATAAGLPGRCTFTVVNSDVINAFAVPGCYIYITRGLLAIMNSEDELASVLGHEVGHVVADHSDRRQNASTLSGLGAVLVGVLSGSGELAQAAGQAAQAYTLGYSRDQEYESDDLGVRYLNALGYDPFAAADMLAALGASSALDAKTRGRDDAERIPEWTRTHPLTENRVLRARERAAGSGLAPASIAQKAAPYLTATNGMLYGDDPSQGFILGRRFAHPTLKLTFEAPDGYSLTNSPQAVLIQGPSGRAMFAGGPLPQQGGLEAYTQSVLKGVLGETPAQVGRLQTADIHGFETAQLPARVQTQDGKTVDIAVTAYRFKPDTAFHFVTLAPAGGTSALAPLLRSFRQMSDQEAAALKPRRIQLVTVGARDTIQTLANRMAFDDFKVERFLTLNALPANATLKVGDQVKIVVFGN
jgi:predicted Zn-dependent protease